MGVVVSLNLTKKHAAILAVAAIVGAGSLGYIKMSNRNPLPNQLQNQVNFKVAYPHSQASINSASYNYQANQKVLTFNAGFAGSNIAFSEQPAPGQLDPSDTQAYYPTLGIHPYAQFKTGLGLVALTKFWQSGTLDPVGQAAVLVSHGTLVIAHTDKPLTNQQWKDLFDGLKLTH